MKISIYIIATLSILITSCGTLNHGRLKYQRVDKSRVANVQDEEAPLDETIDQEYTTYENLGHPVMAQQEGVEAQEELAELNDNNISIEKQNHPTSILHKKQKSILDEIESETSLNSTNSENEEEDDEEDLDDRLAKHAALAGGLSFIPVIGWIFSILAISFGTVALKRLNEDPNKYGGEGHARTGIILGSVTLFVGIILVMLTLVAFAL